MDPAANRSRQATEHLLCAVFEQLLPIARREGLTIKRLRELLVRTQLRLLDKEGVSRFEMVALSGFSRRAVRLLTQDDREIDTTSPLSRFMDHWLTDPLFPTTLPLAGKKQPSFTHLYHKYVSDFTLTGLLKLLKSNDLVKIENGMITALGRGVTSRTRVEDLAAAEEAITALFSTLNHNLYEMNPPLLQRHIQTSTVPVERKAELRGMVSEVLHQASERISQLLHPTQSQAARRDQGKRPAIGIGYYWYELDDEPPPAIGQK